jgi:transcriptional regulator with XRE-family HTH domain
MTPDTTLLPEEEIPPSAGKRRPRSDLSEWRRPEVLERVKELGSRLRWIREKMDLTQAEVAERAQTSLSAVQHVEAGRPKDCAYHIIIADALGCPIYRLYVSRTLWEKFIREKILPRFEARRREALKELSPS